MNMISKAFVGPSIATIQMQIRSGSTSASTMLSAAQIAAKQVESLNALAATDWDRAAAQALAIDDAARSTSLEDKPLLGVPIAVKDLFLVQGMPMAAGSRAPLPNLGCEQALLVDRLIDAGAIVFSKTNMHELALGATGENRWTGDVKNPFDPARQAGGSSSGSAVSVATGIAVAAIGSDTGGSIRIPAGFCGVVGFKPSFGAIPLSGALYLSPSFDHAGPITRCVDDARILYQVMAKRALRESTISREPHFAVPARWLDARLSDDVAQAFARQLARLKQAGAKITEVEIPLLPRAWDFYTPIVRAEAAVIHRESLRTHPQGFSDLVKPALDAGLQVTAGDYLMAQALRATLRNEMDAVLGQYDAMLLPTSAVVPPLRGQLDVTVARGVVMSAREAVLGQTLPFSALGLPTLQIPMAMIAASSSGDLAPVNLPVGLQVVSLQGRDNRVLALGKWIESGQAQLS